MGWLLAAFGELDQGLSLSEKGLALTESSGESWLKAYALGGVGVGYWLQGQPERAEPLVVEGLRLSQAVNNPLSGVACLAFLGWIVAAQKQSTPGRGVDGCGVGGQPCRGVFVD